MYGLGRTLGGGFGFIKNLGIQVSFFHVAYGKRQPLKIMLDFEDSIIRYNV